MTVLPMSGPGGGRRLWRWVVGCLAAGVLASMCLCCALISGVVVWFQQPDTSYPTDPTELAQVVQKEVSQMRGLEFKYPVVVKTLTTEQLRARFQKQLDEEWSPKEARDFALTLAAFDLVDPKIDLYQLYLDLLSEGVVGLYDPETKELYVVSDADQIGVFGRLTLAHELTHALQDQYYDLQALGYSDDSDDKYDSEYLAGLQALVEGDASLLQLQYMSTLSTKDRGRFLLEYSQFDLSTYNSAPEAIVAGMNFPYAQGLVFVQSVYHSGGWKAVNAVFARPPQSTEQILHPDRYRSGDAPSLVGLPPLTATLGSGWRLADEDIMGELYIQLHLKQQVNSAAASDAAEGWGGDRYAVYYNDQSETVLAMVWRSVWDSPAEEGEFVEQYQEYLTELAGHDADSVQDDRMCWQLEQDYRCLVREAGAVAVVRGPDAGVVELILGELAAFPPDTNGQ